MPAQLKNTDIDWDSIPDVGTSGLDTHKLSKEIANVESDGGDYSAVNPHTGALGKYQFVPSYFWEDIKRVTGVKNQQQFLHDPQAQEKFFNYHVKNNLGPAVEDLKGVNAQGYSDDQLAKLVHFKGPEGAKKWLTSGVDDTEENNISIDKYVGKPQNAINWDDVPDIAVDPQKKSPDVSADGLAASSQSGQQGYSWNGPEAPPAIAPVPVQSYSGANPAAIAPAQPELSPSEQTAHSASVLTGDLVQSAQEGKIPAYSQNLNTTPFTEPGNAAFDVSDPHGDPEFTSGYVKHRIAALEQEKQQKIAADTDNLHRESILQEYANKEKELTNAAKNIVGLQLANSEINSGKPNAEGVSQNINDLQNSFSEEMANTDTNGKRLLQQKLDQRNTAIARSQKYDATQLGMKRAALLGNEQAQEDLARYADGHPIDPVRKVSYQADGLNILQSAAQAAQANNQTDIAAELNKNSDNLQDRLEKDNPEYFRKAWGNQVGNYIYNKVDNPLYGSLFTRPQLSEDEIKKYGEESGLKPSQIAQIKPEDVPTASSWYGQAAQGAFNTLTFKDANDPGGKFFTGDMPQAQQQGYGWKHVGGEIASGAGTVAGFMAQGGVVGEALKGAEVLGNVAANAKRYETAANLIPLAASNYNNAYKTSEQLLGDKPKDEGKRLLYSAVEGTIGTALMSLDPATQIGKDGLGALGSDFVSMLKKNNLQDIDPSLFKGNVNKWITNVAKASRTTAEHIASQSFIMGTNQAADNITKMVFDPQHRGGIMDNVGSAAIQGGISMALPSLFAGIGAARDMTPANKSLFWEAGTNPREYQQQLRQLYKDGQLTQDQFHTAYDGVTKASRIINTQVPIDAVVTGKKLTDDQRQEYAWNLLNDENLQDKLDQLNQAPKPDKSQVKIVQDKINELAAQRTDILNKAGEAPEYVKPTAVKPYGQEPGEENQGDQSNGAIATEPQSEEENPAAKKTEPELGNTEQKNIPLSPLLETQEETEKTTSNERNENRQQNGNAPDNQRQESNPESSSEENLRRQEDGQNGQLTNPEENKLQAALPEQPSTVEQKGNKRKRIKLTEEPEEIPVTVTPELQTRDDGTAKGKPEAETEEPLRKAMLENPDQPVDHLLTDKATGESPNDFVDRISKTIQDYAKPEAEGGKPDNTLLVTHSNVIKLLLAAYDKNSKEFDFGKPDLLEQVDKQSSEVGNRYDFAIKDKDGIERNLQVARHGETESNLKDLQRKDNDKLTPAGKEDAVDVANQIKDAGTTPPEIISSDLPRAQETAEIIQQELQKPEEGENIAVHSKEDAVADKYKKEHAPDSIEKLNTETDRPEEGGKPKRKIQKKKEPLNEDQIANEIARWKKIDPGADVEKQIRFMASKGINYDDYLELRDSKKKKDIQQYNDLNDEWKELNPPPTPERSVAENPSSEPQPPVTKSEPQATEPTPEEIHKLNLKRIDDNLIQQKASQKLEAKKRDQAEKEGDIEKANKSNENYYKKQERIDKLNEEREREVKNEQQRIHDEETKSQYKKTADNIRSFGKKIVKDEDMVGSFPGVSPKMVRQFVDKVAEFVEALGNIHVAYDKAVRWLKEQGEKAPTEQEIKEGKENLYYLKPIPKEEPQLTAHKKQWADLAMEDLASGAPYQDVINEVRENDGIRDQTKADIINYIDWHTQDKYAHNSELAESNAPNKLLRDYAMTEGDKWTRMISGETIKDITGDEPLNDQEAKKFELAVALTDSQNMVSKMKVHFGNDILDWGPKMLRQINEIDPGDTVKRAASLIGLMDELRKDRGIYEYELTTLKDNPSDNARREEVNTYLAEIPKLIKAAEHPYQVTMRNASKTLNEGRNMRKLFTGKYAHEMYADDAMLSYEQRKAKAGFTGKEADTTIPDKAAKEGVIRTEADADKEVEQAQEKIAKPKEESQEKKKGKNIVRKITDAVKKAKDKDKAVLDRMKKEAQEKFEKKGFTQDNVYDKLKDMIKKTKC